MFLSYMVVDLSVLAAQPEENAVRYPLHTLPLSEHLDDVATDEMFIRTFTSLTLWLNIHCIIGFVIAKWLVLQ